MAFFLYFRNYQFIIFFRIYLLQINVYFFGPIRKRRGPKSDTYTEKGSSGSGLALPQLTPGL